MPIRIAFMLLWTFIFTIPLTFATEFPMAMTLSRGVGIAAMIAGVIAVVARKRVRVLGTVHMAMAGFILWSAVTLSWSVAPDVTLQRIESYLQLFVLVLLVWEMCLEEKDILRMLGAFVLGTIVPAVMTLSGFLPGQSTLLDRAATPGYDPNQLAFLLALSLPASYFLILREKGPQVSLYRLQMGFAVIAVLLTGSAAPMIAMVVGLSMMFWTLDAVPVEKRMKGLAVLLLLIALTVAVIPTRVWQGVAEQTHKGEIALTSVLSQEAESIHKTPIGGLGAGTQASPTSFTMLAETGVVGLACFLVMLGVLISAARRMSAVNRTFWKVSLAVWAIGAFSLNWDCSQPAWLIFGLLAAHSACLSEKSADPAEDPAKAYCFAEAAISVS